MDGIMQASGGGKVAWADWHVSIRHGRARERTGGARGSGTLAWLHACTHASEVVAVVALASAVAAERQSLNVFAAAALQVNTTVSAACVA
eukprot:64781-Chlamydomonas_euryale.AAC.1